MESKKFIVWFNCEVSSFQIINASNPDQVIQIVKLMSLINNQESLEVDFEEFSGNIDQDNEGFKKLIADRAKMRAN